MATFKNRKSGETFTVSDDQQAGFAARPALYEPVDVYPCPDCDRIFDTPQGIASHSRTHEG